MTDNGKPLCVLDHGTDHYGQPRYREAARGLLCQPHRSRLDADVQEIETLWCELALVLDGSGVQDETPRVRRGKIAEAPAPLALDVVSLRDPRTKAQRIPPDPAKGRLGDPSEPLMEIPGRIASWVLLLAEERPLPMWRFEWRLRIRKNRATALLRKPVAIPLPQSTVAQLRLLAKHHDWIAGRSWVEDYVRELAEMRKALKVAVRDHTHREVGRCLLPTDDSPRCNGPLLEENGTGIISCPWCRARWITPQERARLAVALEDEARAKAESA